MSSYDRFADSRLGGLFTRYILNNIDKNPSLFQRAAINTAMGAAYISDRMLSAGAGTSPAFRISKRPLGATQQRMHMYRGKVHGHNATGYMRDLGQRHQNHIRGCGALYGKHKHTPRAVLYNKRIHQNEPISVSHEIKQELRSEPGSQAVVTMIGERLLPKTDYSGALYRSVNRVSDAPGAAQQNFFLYNEYTGASSTAPTTGVVLDHRRDWTMGTNAAWRDGFAIANGQMRTEVLMEQGYQTPYITQTTFGSPQAWHMSPTDVVDPSTGVPSVQMNPSISTPAAAVVLRNYYHLYEEISWKIQNNSVTGTTVTVYECVLNRDIPMNDTPSFENIATVQWGGLPCPLELWRQSRELAYGKAAPLTEDGDIWLSGGLPFNPVPAAEDEGPGVASAQLQKDPTTAGAVRGMEVADIDYPNVRPNKAALLHTYYKVRAHTRYLPPGADTTITVGVRYNKRIPGAWWNTMYGVADFTRCFFMVNRPDEVVGITGADGSGVTPIDGKNRMPVMNASDLMVSWTKKKTVCRVKQRMRHAFRYKAAIPGNLDVAIRNPITLKVHDADVFMGEDADEEPEAPGA